MKTTLSLREIKKQECRDAIVHAARDLFNEKGYHDTTMKEIAELAHISPASLFNYFPSKMDILLQVVQMKRHDFDSIMSTEEYKSFSRRKQLLVLFKDFLEDMFKYPRLNIDVWQMLRFNSLIEGDSSKLIIPITQIIDHGIAEGEFNNSLKVDFIIDIFFGLSFCAMLRGGELEKYCSEFNSILGQYITSVSTES